MISFFDFFKKNEVASLPMLPPSHTEQLQLPQISVEKSVAVALHSEDSIPKSDIEPFSKSISELVTSDEFLLSLSDKIEKPRKNETEDEFVARCKKSLFSLIDKTLNK